MASVCSADLAFAKRTAIHTARGEQYGTTVHCTLSYSSCAVLHTYSHALITSGDTASESVRGHAGSGFSPPRTSAAAQQNRLAMPRGAKREDERSERCGALETVVIPPDIQTVSSSPEHGGARGATRWLVWSSTAGRRLQSLSLWDMDLYSTVQVQPSP